MSSGSWFLSLAPGEKAVVAFLGAPLAIQTVFVDGRTHPFDERWAAQGKKPSTRVRINVWDVASGLVKIWDVPVHVFKKVLALKDKAGADFENTFYSITRTGTGKETRYEIAFSSAMDSEARQTKSTLPLHGLEPKRAVESRTSVQAPVPRPVPAPVKSSAPPASADPFDAQPQGVTRRQLQELMRGLPESLTAEALELGGWQRVSDIPEDQLDEVYNALAATAIMEV